MRTANELGSTSPADFIEPATEIAATDTTVPGPLVPDASAEISPELETREPEVESKAGKYLDEDGNWDIDALKAYFKDPSASDDKLRAFLGYDILYHELIAPRDRNAMILRLESNKRVRIGDRMLNLEPLERLFINLMLLTPDGRIDIYKLQDAGILKDEFEKNRGAALDVAAKFNMCATKDILIKIEADADSYCVAMTQPMRVKEPMYARSFRSLEKTPAFLGLGSS